MRTTEAFVNIPGPGPGQSIRAAVVRPAGGAAWPGLVLYSDIFQLTESTLRTVRRVASAGFVVCAPEIYPHGELAGVALTFDDDGKRMGQGAADATPTSDFDADRTAVLDYLAGRPDTRDSLLSMGFCLGGHLAFRAGFDPRVGATCLYYPTGLHDGALGADVAGSLAQAAELTGRLMLVFGSADPHVPADARLHILTELVRLGLDPEVHLVPGEHAFMRDIGERHDPALTDLALAAGFDFLRRR